MRLAISALLFTLVLLAIPAHAASFSCEAAVTPVETAICGDDTLSQTDSVMALAFAHAMAGLTEEAGIVARQGQRDWLAYSETVCADENLRGDDVPEVERVTCLQRLYDHRLEILEQNRQVNGHRFYTVDRYAALPDDDARFKLGLKITSSLRVDGATPFAQAFNAAATEITAAYSGHYEDFAGTTMDDTVPHKDNSSLMTIISHNEARLSVRLDLEWYGHGAAHPNASFGMFHFLFDEARQLEMSDVFADKRWQSSLAGLVAERASADIRLGEISYTAENMASKVDDPLQWLFTNVGLMIEFEPGEVLPNGTPAIVVPWMALEDVLADGGYAIVVWD
jgi:uncharacterized protein